jgi:hypothetical protein
VWSNQRGSNHASFSSAGQFLAVSALFLSMYPQRISVLCLHNLVKQLSAMPAEEQIVSSFIPIHPRLAMGSVTLTLFVIGGFTGA